ncbi:MAG: hypothetical protein GY679_02380 [Mycoplasma sp.]|nr:hypothetical protein [Mycoplasma sp.]
MNKKDSNYSTEIDFKKILDYNNEDRKYNSVMDEYKRYFSKTKKISSKILTKEDLWEFIKFFFQEAYGIDIADDWKVGKKVFVKQGTSSVKVPMYIFWNKKNYEFSLEKRDDAELQIITRIKTKRKKVFFIYKKNVHSPTTIWGFRGEIKKFFFKYYHKKNAKVIFEKIKLMENFKKETGSIDGFKKYIKKRAI